MNKIELADEALKHLGRFTANKYFGNSHRNLRQYYCPSVLSSPMRWRFFLARILDECLKNNCGINDLNKTWEDWAKCIRTNFAKIVESCFLVLQYDLPEEQFNEIKFNAPRGFGKERVIDKLIINEERKSSIKITTIHGIKGKTFDAVLLVSSPDARGAKGGHWQEWLKDADSEPARFAYVASSRPRKLLAWAVPEGADLTKIQQLGFNPSD